MGEIDHTIEPAEEAWDCHLNLWKCIQGQLLLIQTLNEKPLLAHQRILLLFAGAQVTENLGQALVQKAQTVNLCWGFHHFLCIFWHV